jgi:hypothetical protein
MHPDEICTDVPIVLAAASERFRRQMLGLYMPSICLYRTPYSNLPWHLKFSQVYAKGLASRNNRSVRSYTFYQPTINDQPNEQVEYFHLELSTSHSGVPMSGITWAIWLVKTPGFGLWATSQQYFSLTTNQPPATNQQCSSLRTNQHQSSATSQSNRLLVFASENSRKFGNSLWLMTGAIWA